MSLGTPVFKDRKILGDMTIVLEEVFDKRLCYGIFFQEQTEAKPLNVKNLTTI